MNASNRIISDQQAKEFLEIIDKEDPDVLCLQEVKYKSHAKIRQTLDTKYLYTPNEGQKRTKRYVLYSKYPLRNFHRLGETKIYAADVKLGEKWSRIYSCHLTSNGYTTARRKVINEGRNWFAGLPEYIDNMADGIRQRKAEADEIRQSIDSLNGTGMPVLVIGDLNDFSGSSCLRTIEADDMDDAWWHCGNGFGFTYDSWHLKLRIDHVLYSRENLSPISIKIINTDISDHKPIISEIDIK